MQQCNVGCMLRVGDLVDVRQADCTPADACDEKKCQCTIEHGIVTYNKPYVLVLRSNPEPGDQPTFLCETPMHLGLNYKRKCDYFLLNGVEEPFKLSYITYDPAKVRHNTDHRFITIQFLPTKPERSSFPVYRNDLFYLQIQHGTKQYNVGIERLNECVRLQFGKDVPFCKFSWEPDQTDQLFGITHIVPRKPIDLNLQAYDDEANKWFNIGPWRTPNGHLVLTSLRGRCEVSGESYFSNLRIEDIGELPELEKGAKLCGYAVNGKLVMPPCPKGYSCVQHWCFKDPVDQVILDPHIGETRQNVKLQEVAERKKQVEKHKQLAKWGVVGASYQAAGQSMAPTDDETSIQSSPSSPSSSLTWFYWMAFVMLVFIVYLGLKNSKTK